MQQVRDLESSSRRKREASISMPIHIGMGIPFLSFFEATNDQPTSISINRILTAPFTRVGSTGSGDSTRTLWQDAEGEQAIETNGDPVFPGAYGFAAARIRIVGDYSDFTTYLPSDPGYEGCTEEEHDAIYTRLTQMIEGKFPGITVKKSLKSKTTGPDELTCDAISLWIEENWTTACSDVLE